MNVRCSSAVQYGKRRSARKEGRQQAATATLQLDSSDARTRPPTTTDKRRRQRILHDTVHPTGPIMSPSSCVTLLFSASIPQQYTHHVLRVPSECAHCVSAELLSMTSATQQPSREELLAIGKRKLLEFQQSKGRGNANASLTQPATLFTPSSVSITSISSVSRLPSVNGTSGSSARVQPAAFTTSSSRSSLAVNSSLPTSLQASAASPLAALVASPAPHRDLPSFLESATASEPSTPPSSDFRAPHASFLQADHAGHEPPASSSSSSSVTPTRPLSAASAVPLPFSSLAPSSSTSSGRSDAGLSTSSTAAYDARVDYNPYAEPPPAVLARSGAVTPQPADAPPAPSLAQASKTSAAGASIAAEVDNSSDASIQSYFSSSLSSAAPSAFTPKPPSHATSPASSPAPDTQLPALSSSSSHAASIPSTASSAPSTASAAEADQSYDTSNASVQYYQDDAGNIFYYAADGQPVYYNQVTGEYSTTPPSMTAATSSLSSSSVPPVTSTTASSADVSTLQQKVAEYESYIATLQSSLVSSSASPLPALSSLSAELDHSRTDHERLQGQLRQLQSRLESQSKAMSELMEDNATLVHEYEEVCEQLQGAEQERRQGWIKQRDENTELAAREEGLRAAGGALSEHSDLLQQLSDDSARVQRELIEGTQLTTTIRSQWQHVLQLIQHALEHSFTPSAPSPSDGHTAVVRANGIDGSKANWLTVLQHAEALSSFLSQKSDHDHQLSMHIAHIRQLLDPVALVLSPSRSTTSAVTLPLLMPSHSSSPSSSVASSTAVVPSADTSLVPFDHSSSTSSSSSGTVIATLNSLQAENSMLHEQLAAQQERAATLIKDKVMLAKRIESAFEEKAVLTESLREALDELGREKEMYRQAVQEAHDTAIRASNATAYTPTGMISSQRGHDRYVDDSGSMHAAYQRLHTPIRQSGARLPSSSSKARRAVASRREADEATGLFGSLWSMVFGSSIAQIIADDEEDEDELVGDRDLEADRVVVL